MHGNISNSEEKQGHFENCLWITKVSVSRNILTFQKPPVLQFYTLNQTTSSRRKFCFHKFKDQLIVLWHTGLIFKIHPLFCLFACLFVFLSVCLCVCFLYVAQRMRLDSIFCRDITRHLIRLELFHFPSLLLFRQFHFHNSSHVLLFLELTFGVWTQCWRKNKKLCYCCFLIIFEKWKYCSFQIIFDQGGSESVRQDRKLPIQFWHLFLLWRIGCQML